MAGKGLLARPTFAFPMIATCAVVGVFLVYYFPVTARQETILNQRAFRSLAAVSESVTGRIANYADVLEQADRRLATVDARFVAGPGNEFAVVRRDPAVCYRGGTWAETATGSGVPRIAMHCGGLTGTIALDRLLPPFLDALHQVFDDVVLTNPAGVVLYQSASGVRLTNLPAALTPAAADPKAGTPPKGADEFAVVSQVSTLFPARIGGENYLAYLAPVTVGVTATGTASRLVLTGLMREKRFRSASLALPGTAVIIPILVALILLVAAWPLLKFATMGPTDRVPARSAAYLFLSTLGTVLLICALVIHIRYVSDLQRVDAELEALGDAMERNLDAELTLALRVMQSANDSAMLHAALSPAASCEAPSGDEVPARFAVRELLSRTGVRLSDYPYFERLFWTDNAGFQLVKWEAGAETPASTVDTRVYFVETMADRLWQLAPGGPSAPRFRVDPVYSRNSGEYRAIISQRLDPVPACGDRQLRMISMVTALISLINPVMRPDYGFAVVDPAGKVLFHSTSVKNGQERFLDELADPSGVQAALYTQQRTRLTVRYLGLDHRLFVTPLSSLQQSGWSLIVFHNLSARATEHFERMVLFGALEISYFLLVAAVVFLLHGARPPAWLWPQRERRGDCLHLALTLLVLVPPFYALTFDLLLTRSVLWFAYLIPVVTLGAGVLKLRRAGAVARGVALAALAIGLIVLVATDTQSFHHLAPLVVIVLAVVALLFRDDLSRLLARVPAPGLTGSFTLAWAACLAMVALLPTVGFFRVAYDFHGNLSTRRQQVQTMTALAARETRETTQYRNTVLIASGSAREQELARWLFVRRRLDQTLDRYDGVLLEASSGQRFSPDVRAVRAEPGRATVGDDCEDDLSGYVASFAAIRIYDSGLFTTALAQRPSEKSTWRWCRDGVNRLRLQGRINAAGADLEALRLPPTRALLKSVTGDPAFLHPELMSELPLLEPLSTRVMLLAFMVLGLGTFAWMRPTLRQLFLLEIPAADPLPTLVLDPAAPPREDVILLARCSARASAVLRTWPDVVYVDMAVVVAGSAPDPAALAGSRTIVLDHFDVRNDESDANLKKVELLERIAQTAPEATVVIAAAVDPVFFFDADSDPAAPLTTAAAGNDPDRWELALSRFRRVRVAEPLPEAPMTRGRLIWSTCTTAERIALDQLSHDGWVNPRNAGVLEHLQLLGLVGGRPLRFTDAGLAAFVADWVTHADRRTWRAQAEASTWDGVRLMFVVLIIGVVAAALFFSQQSVLGLVAAVLTVLAPITKLLSEANSLRSLMGLGKKAA